jgi:hypothetical protein
VYSDLLLAAIMEMQAQHAPADYRCTELNVSSLPKARIQRQPIGGVQFRKKAKGGLPKQHLISLKTTHASYQYQTQKENNMWCQKILGTVVFS